MQAILFAVDDVVEQVDGARNQAPEEKSCKTLPERIRLKKLK
jgi:hypothetical protein